MVLSLTMFTRLVHILLVGIKGILPMIRIQMLNDNAIRRWKSGFTNYHDLALIEDNHHQHD